MRYMKLLAVVSLAVLVFSNCAIAGETPGAFRIKKIFVSNGTNFHFRVMSDTPANWLCDGGPTNDAWAFINENDSGAKVKISALLMAFALGKRVELVTEGVDTDVGHMCRIIEVAVLGD